MTTAQTGAPGVVRAGMPQSISVDGLIMPEDWPKVNYTLTTSTDPRRRFRKVQPAPGEQPTCKEQSFPNVVTDQLFDVDDLSSLRGMFAYSHRPSPLCTLTMGAPVHPVGSTHPRRNEDYMDKGTALLVLDFDEDRLHRFDGDGLPDDPRDLVASLPAPLRDVEMCVQRSSSHGYRDGVNKYRLYCLLDSLMTLPQMKAVATVAGADTSIYQAARAIFLADPVDAHGNPLPCPGGERFEVLSGSSPRASVAALLRLAPPPAPPVTAEQPTAWTTGPQTPPPGSADDDELIRRALNARPSAAAAFDGGVTFADLWNENTDALAQRWPGKTHAYDGSAADLALANGLIFWTGGDCERTLYMMKRSGLANRDPDKWDRSDYLQRTILKALAGWEPTEPTGAGADTVTARGGFRLTDLGNAERFEALHGQEVRFCPGQGWLEWKQGRWKRDETGDRVRQRAAATARAIWNETKAADNDDARKRIASHAAKSEGAQRVEAMLKLSCGRPGILAEHDTFDADPLLLNVKNGTVDLRDGTLKPHDPANMITKLAPFNYDPDAQAPTWDRFLADIIPDPDVRDYLQRAVGYSATGGVEEQVLFFLHGGGQNGKSTFIETISLVMGDYSGPAPRDLLMVSHNANRELQATALHGRRLIVSQESEENRRLDEATVKALTGGDRIQARPLYQVYFDFAPTHKLWLSSNHKPRIKGTDFAIWRRVKLIPFDVQIADDKKDGTLKGKLKKEGPGILRWIVDGARAWQQRRLDEPEAVKGAIAEYRDAEDLFAQWMEECCTCSPGAWEPSAMLYHSFRSWCESHGERSVMKQNAFGMRLKKEGYLSTHTREGAIWRGLSLASSPRCGQGAAWSETDSTPPPLKTAPLLAGDGFPLFPKSSRCDDL